MSPPVIYCRSIKNLYTYLHDQALHDYGPSHSRIYGYGPRGNGLSPLLGIYRSTEVSVLCIFLPTHIFKKSLNEICS